MDGLVQLFRTRLCANCPVRPAWLRCQRATLAARPFYSMCPQGAWLYPFVGIAALATIIASQALISGVFSLTYQAVQLGFFPRLTVRHTSDEAEGQIYIPLMNWGLAVACVLLVLVFQESGKLAAAFGLDASGGFAPQPTATTARRVATSGRRQRQGAGAMSPPIKLPTRYRAIRVNQELHLFYS